MIVLTRKPTGLPVGISEHAGYRIILFLAIAELSCIVRKAFIASFVPSPASTMPFFFPRSLEPSLRARHVRLVEDADER